MAIPHKRYTFDLSRPITSVDHLIKGYVHGPEWGEDEHYYEFVKYTDHGIGKSDTEIKEVIKELKSKNFSIHYHVWDHQAMLDMFIAIKNKFKFKFKFKFKYEIELSMATLNIN